MVPNVCQFGDPGWARTTTSRQMADYCLRRRYRVPGSGSNNKDGGSVVADLLKCCV
ncbi:hypothetical protein DPMN_173739 [Dreissena polymorpha]|uniref:Uncharacterized protein n=1 Tax=Dreissena polymorpha TaxID=45954 RepID=A0A9D4IEH3_DREPO|nr:hypothetical protein DPMN_173739 [Dreissena polymorpha]